MSVFLEVCVVLLVIVLGAFIYCRLIFRRWKNKNLPMMAEPSFPLGNIPNPFTSVLHPGIFCQNAYEKLKSQGHRHGIAFLSITPKYIPVDPTYIKNILQRDFTSFTDRGLYYDEENDPLSANLLTVRMAKWRYLRAKLSPAFTPGKMKIMFDQLVLCAGQMREAVGLAGEPLDILDVSACYTTDVIGACAFGLECNSFKNPDAEFRKFGKKLVDFKSVGRLIKVIFVATFPGVSRYLGVRQVDDDCKDFFVNVVKSAVEFRKNDQVVRKDILQLLLDFQDEVDVSKNSCELKEGGEEAIVELAAQVLIFFIAGYDTSSITLSFCLYELAINKDIQKKLRSEVEDVLKANQGKITYESVSEMVYLGQVVDETLRKYPPVPIIPRECTEDYQIPGTNATIEKGTGVFIPVLALHRDPAYYPEPLRFNPDRFTEENRKNATPFTYLPFGEGPKICIGYRFGLMQIKVGLVVLLKDYEFSLNPKTKPVVFDPNHILMTPKTDILLDVRRLRD